MLTSGQHTSPMTEVNSFSKSPRHQPGMMVSSWILHCPLRRHPLLRKLPMTVPNLYQKVVQALSWMPCPHALAARLELIDLFVHTSAKSVSSQVVCRHIIETSWKLKDQEEAQPALYLQHSLKLMNHIRKRTQRRLKQLDASTRIRGVS